VVVFTQPRPAAKKSPKIRFLTVYNNPEKTAVDAQTCVGCEGLGHVHPKELHEVRGIVGHIRPKPKGMTVYQKFYRVLWKG
jgi:hypothetical protein